MTSIELPVEAPLEVPEPSNLTYFAFAGSSNQSPSSCETTLPVGELPEVLCDRYKVERLLGVGGMGAVYRVRDLLREQFGDPEPYIALKTLNEDFAHYPDANALLYAEFALTSRLRHANVIQVHAFDVDPGSQRAFITLELLKGCTLDQVLDEHPEGLPWNNTREIVVQLLEALGHAHGLGVLHGDLKPSNVMVGDHGLRLFDFGLGQGEGSYLPGLPRLSRKRFAAWTPRYAAPELLDGEPLTVAADIYAIACVLYEVCYGTHPFRRRDAKQAKALELKLSMPPQLSRTVADALRAGLSFDPDARISLPELIGAFRDIPTLSRWTRWRRRS